MTIELFILTFTATLSMQFFKHPYILSSLNESIT